MAIRSWLLALFLSLSPIMAETLRFAPLPMEKAETVISQYLPMLDYLETQTGFSFEIVYSPDYQALLQSFKQGEIDIAYLGPLPLVQLHLQAAHATPFVRFLNANQQGAYTCALISRENSIQQIDQIRPSHTVALTQPLSTCGYLMTATLLKRQNLSLADMQYEYTGSHANSALSVIIGQHDIGGLKTSIARQYLFHGLKILAETRPIPGFALVANTDSVTPATMTTITQSLLALHPKNSEQDANTIRRWGQHLQYGVEPATIEDYDAVMEALKHTKIPTGNTGYVD